MAAEILAGLSAIKTAFDLAKGLKDINDATIRNRAVIELQEKILAARDTQSALLDRISELEKEVARFETWEAEKQRYELTDAGDGNFAYIVKPPMRGTEPPHYVCANCYEQRKKSILHHMQTGGMGHLLSCSSCNAKLLIRHGYKQPA